MLSKKVFFILISSATFFHAQISNDSILAKINKAKNIVADQNPKEALKMVLETKELSEKNHYDFGIMKSSYTMMLIYYNSGNYKKVIEESKSTEKYAFKLNDYEFLADVFRMKAITYIEMGFPKEALQELSKAIPYAEKVALKNKSLYKKALIYEAYAGAYEKIGDNERQIENRHKSILASKKMQDTAKSMLNAKFHNLALQYGSLAYTYNLMKKKDSALYYFKEALKVYDRKDADIQIDGKATLLSDLAVFYANNKDYRNSIKFARQAEKLEKQTTLPYIRRDIFKSLFDSYAGINKIDSSKYYLNSYTALNDSIIKVEKKSLYTPVNQILSDKEKDKNTTIKSVIIISAAISFALLLCGWLFWRRKNKKLQEDYQKLIEKYRNHNKDDISIKNSSDNNVNTLLQKLDIFEKSGDFTDTSITLKSLASHLETSQDELSGIIREYKQKSFDSYINSLRIDHIVFLLYSDPKTRVFREDYLAKNNGFASKSEFTAAFKKSTGIPFSYFIKKLEKESVK